MLRHLWLSAPNRLWSLTVIRAGQNGGVTGNTPIRLTLQNSPTILLREGTFPKLQLLHYATASTMYKGYMGGGVTDALHNFRGV